MRSVPQFERAGSVMTSASATEAMSDYEGVPQWTEQSAPKTRAHSAALVTTVIAQLETHREALPAMVVFKDGDGGRHAVMLDMAIDMLISYRRRCEEFERDAVARAIEERLARAAEQWKSINEQRFEQIANDRANEIAKSLFAEFKKNERNAARRKAVKRVK